ncbi:hypothetical protein GALMADRAFT_713596 [Galerina marginata CBS 339.88]|uniref:Uncharacterized protein n=1 Tax=Galerina marginata (strain CBS 339.88) TaxID=685588 RepID=A0A067TZH2_GALM3|nr:hypothetical protein GALMADRAFT_713596 [Galerina marginata CBS 339.88]
MPDSGQIGLSFLTKGSFLGFHSTRPKPIFSKPFLAFSFIVVAYGPLILVSLPNSSESQ